MFHVHLIIIFLFFYFCQWAEIRVPTENLSMHKVDMQTPFGKYPGWEGGGICNHLGDTVL